jgi:hypothetical protein
MLHALTLPGLLATTVPAALAAVYVYSGDPGRRRRAWQLLLLLRHRR